MNLATSENRKVHILGGSEPICGMKAGFEWEWLVSDHEPEELIPELCGRCSKIAFRPRRHPMSLTLTDKEATVFAYRVALQQLAASDMWLDWEDYPYLADHAFNDMDRHVQVTVPNYLRDAMRLMEDTWGIDGADLMEQAQISDTPPAPDDLAL